MKYQKIINNKTQCLICPRQCILAQGQEGFCHVRKNIGGDIILTTYGFNTGLAIDPVEKKPLYHFYPGSKILSFGTLGCCMGCRFCQNWRTTKNNTPAEYTLKANPEQILNAAKKYAVKSIAFTYNDPIVFFEYALDCAKLSREEGIKTVAVTSGFMNLKPAKEFYGLMDAANIDLKGFSEEFYAKNCLAKLSPVLQTIKYAVTETPCWVELTTMLIEGENDSPELIKRECDWILNNLGDNVPLHFSAFVPHYKFKNHTRTGFAALANARNIALEAGLKYVYTGNIANRQTSATYCKNCGKLLISRISPVEYNLENNNCAFCAARIDGVF